MKFLSKFRKLWSEEQIPRGLKPARNEKNLNGAAKAAPLQNTAKTALFNSL